MKNCPNCNSKIEDNFNICWNCNFSLTEEKFIKFEGDSQRNKELDCLRCKTKMKFFGNQKFHEGAHLGIFTNKEAFAVYVCPKCGKIEFFVPET